MQQLRRLGVTVGRFARSRIARFGLAGWILGLVALAAAPASLALNPVTLSTPYPAIEVAPGAKVSLAISVETENAGRVNLTIEDVPDGWLATLRGGGFLVNGVHATGSEATEVTLDVTVPESAGSSVEQLTLRADSDGSIATLPVDIRVTPNAAGEVALETEFADLKGSAEDPFSFNLTLRNGTPDDLEFGVVATAPAGWTANATVTSQAQAASAIVDAGGTTAIKVDVEAPEGVEAGVYPITVDATSGNRTAHADLSVEVTGRFELELTTPDGRLSANASAGSVTDLTLLVRNLGTAPVEGVTFSGAAPTGWEVTFEPDTPVTVPADEQGVQVIAHLTPSGNAIAGDYVTTFRASSDQANASAEFRVTIETSLLWGIVGLALIALVVAGLWWTFRRYGRR
jgi:uncharacterized membrane protein